MLNLKQGLGENKQYNAWVFPGGELHIRFSKETIEEMKEVREILVETRITCSDDFMLLALTLDTIEKDFPDKYVYVNLGYIPYQQADRDFGVGESFSLATFASLMSYLPYNRLRVFDPHSDVSAALLRKVERISNKTLVENAIHRINREDLVILSPDAGAYKKVSKLVLEIGFKGEFVAANKYRELSAGNIESLELSKQDFEGKPVLIVDDICIGGRTFILLAEKLKEKNAGDLYLVVSHGIFFAGYDPETGKKRYSSEQLEKYFKTIYTSDTIRDKSISENVQIAFYTYVNN